jgi:hypothetical protein
VNLVINILDQADHIVGCIVKCRSSCPLHPSTLGTLFNLQIKKLTNLTSDLTVLHHLLASFLVIFSYHHCNMTSYNFSPQFGCYTVQDFLDWDSYLTAATAEPLCMETFPDPQLLAGRDVGTYEYVVADDPMYVDDVFIFHSTLAKLDASSSYIQDPHLGSLLPTGIDPYDPKTYPAALYETEGCSLLSEAGGITPQVYPGHGQHISIDTNNCKHHKTYVVRYVIQLFE